METPKKKAGRPCLSNLDEGKERAPAIWFPIGQLARLKREARALGIPYAEHARRLLGATEPITGGE